MSESRESTSEGAAPDGSFEGAFAPLGFPWPTPPTEIPRADSFTPSDARGPQRGASDHGGGAARAAEREVGRGAPGRAGEARAAASWARARGDAGSRSGPRSVLAAGPARRADPRNAA